MVRLTTNQIKPMKKIYFTQVADSRFTPDTKKEMTRIVSQIDVKLGNASIKYWRSDIRDLDWGDTTSQKRVDYRIDKTPMFTYNQLFKIINSVKATPYSIQ